MAVYDEDDGVPSHLQEEEKIPYQEADRNAEASLKDLSALFPDFNTRNMGISNETTIPSHSKSVSFAIDGQVHPVTTGQTLKVDQVKSNAVLPYEDEELLDDELFSNLKLRSRMR